MLELGRLGDGLNLRRVPALGREISLRDDLQALVMVRRIAREFRPDIVHTHLAKAGTIGRIAARMSGASVVIHTYHGTVFSGYFGRTKSSAFIAIERGLARLTTRLIAITPSQRRELLRLGIGDTHKVVEIPLGLELSQFVHPHNQLEARARLALPLDLPIVAIVGRLVPVKNVALFLGAVALIKEPVIAVIVGDGEQRGQLEALSASLGIADRCRFIGWQRDVGLAYAAADVVALTSLNEGSPVSILEAMASRRAVVCTAVGGVPDVVTSDVSGVLVPPGDPYALAAAIAALLRDPMRRERLGSAAQLAVYPHYDVSRLLADVTRLYDGLVPAV